MNIYYLSDKFPWLGEHTSYGQLPSYIQKLNYNTKIVTTKFGLFQRCTGKAYSISHGWWWRQGSEYSAAEFRFSRFLSENKKQDNLFHILYFDFHHFLCERWKRAPKNIIGTIHNPHPRRISPRMIENLKRLSSAIVLYQCDLELYESYIGRNNVKFIHHGVDTDFFCPAKQKEVGPKHIMFTGQNGRNTVMLYRIITKLAKRYSELRFDLLVRKVKRSTDGLFQLINHPNVDWHENLSDEELLQLYQKSYLLLLPMNETSANNATVEALSCGLPVVTTDVGGIRDYGGGSIYPVVANNDDDAMIELIERYISHLDWRNEISMKCREFTEQNLAWPLIAEKHLKVYRELAE